ncbi:HAD-IA family hydrolase [Hydrogenophaga sp. 5NK40-0174]|uniref:HAD-IA family hydrolase n=1 Tax=Hydrogenophaga sp. 5NK40-0174 TaxID=3127649 RepID=UPI003105B011
MSKLAALIFDLDGTLADTESLHRAAFNYAFREEGMDWHWDEALYTRLLDISGGKERMLHYWRETHPDVTEVDGGAVDGLIAKLHEIKTAYYEAKVKAGEISLRPGVLALMNEARANGVELAIATTTSAINVAALMGSALGDAWRDNFVAVRDASNAPLKKPHPQVYERVLQDIGLPAQVCIAFEDSSNGLKAATAAGLATVITPTSFTSHNDFTGALKVLKDLSGVGIEQLRQWRSQADR